MTNEAESMGIERPHEPRSDTPLHVRIEDDQLVIRIGIDRLDGHEEHPELHPLSICDRRQWAKDVAAELERDRGDGATPLCLMLNAAMKEALKMGSAAIDYKRPTTRSFEEDDGGLVECAMCGNTYPEDRMNFVEDKDGHDRDVCDACYRSAVFGSNANVEAAPSDNEHED